MGSRKRLEGGSEKCSWGPPGVGFEIPVSFRVRKASFSLQTGERSIKKVPNGPRCVAKVVNRG